MTIIPINGKNERLGKLFKNPKHLLLYEGMTAIERTVNYMTDFGPCIIFCNEQYDNGLRYFNRKIVPSTSNVIETLKEGIIGNFNTELFIVDCDVIPRKLNKPKGNTVYLFKNETKKNHYSNFEVRDGTVISCNEKESIMGYAGAGIYYFRYISEFLKYSNYCTSVSQVISKMLKNNVSVHADTTSDIFRFGTLHDINGL